MHSTTTTTLSQIVIQQLLQMCAIGISKVKTLRCKDVPQGSRVGRRAYFKVQGLGRSSKGGLEPAIVTYSCIKRKGSKLDCSNYRPISLLPQCK